MGLHIHTRIEIIYSKTSTPSAPSEALVAYLKTVKKYHPSDSFKIYIKRKGRFNYICVSVSERLNASCNPRTYYPSGIEIAAKYPELALVYSRRLEGGTWQTQCIANKQEVHYCEQEEYEEEDAAFQRTHIKTGSLCHEGCICRDRLKLYTWL